MRKDVNNNIKKDSPTLAPVIVNKNAQTKHERSQISKQCTTCHWIYQEMLTFWEHTCTLFKKNISFFLAQHLQWITQTVLRIHCTLRGTDKFTSRTPWQPVKYMQIYVTRMEFWGQNPNTSHVKPPQQQWKMSGSCIQKL